MKVKEFLKQHKYLILVAVIALLIVVRTSYAVFNINVDSSEYNYLKSGNLVLNLDESASNGIKIDPAYPLTDAEGLDTPKYQFVLENTGNITADFTMYLDDITTAEKKMAYSIIRFNLKKQLYNSTGVLKDNQPTDRIGYITSLIVSDKFIVDGGTLAPGEKIVYNLNLWMDYNAGNEYQGTSFKGRLRIEGAQQYTKISNAYKYDQDHESTLCITGNEKTCVETDCYSPGKTCSSGDIVDYMVNGLERVRFHVLFDNGTVMTMQSQTNTVFNTAWNSQGSNSSGPTTILAALNAATYNWNNVNDVIYTAGSTVFKTNAYTGCSTTGCTINKYTSQPSTIKARLITVQEANVLGCNGTKTSCPNWMYTDLDSTSNESYWTLSASTSSEDDAINIDYNNGLNIYNVTASTTGARAVVEVTK